LVIHIGDGVVVLIFWRTYSKQICNTALTAFPWIALSMAPDGRREAALHIDVVVEMAIASIEGRLDQSVMVSVGADLGGLVVGRNAHIQLWASARQRRDPEILTRCDCSCRKLKVFMRSVSSTVFFCPVGTDVMRHVVSVENPEAHWMRCVWSWLFINPPFRLYDDRSFGSTGRRGLRLAVLVSVATVSKRADKGISSNVCVRTV
jgi:hypothetical protein